MATYSLYGLGTKADYEICFDFISKAAKEDNKDIYFLSGELYYVGRDVIRIRKKVSGTLRGFCIYNNLTGDDRT